MLSVYAASVPAQIAGGYGDASVTDKDVMRSARVAVSSRARRTHTSVKLIRIEKAEVQVVAGLNYRVCLRVREGRRVRTVTAVVYKNLKNWYSLTDWKAGGCTEL